jgi:hypothetical protein
MYGFYKTTLVSALIAACSVLLTTAITAEPRSTPQAGENNSIVLPTSSSGILSQCGDYYTFKPKATDYGVVPENYDKEYSFPSMIVPVYGFMSRNSINLDEATQQKQNTNPYTLPEINRTLWEGHSFIWVDKKTTPETYDYLHSYADNWNKTHAQKVIVLTWNGVKPLPLGRAYAFSSWTISQSCMSFSEKTFEEFLEQAKEQNAGREIALLPKATLTSEGLLPKVETSTPNK